MYQYGWKASKNSERKKKHWKTPSVVFPVYSLWERDIQNAEYSVPVINLKPHRDHKGDCLWLGGTGHSKITSDNEPHAPSPKSGCMQQPVLVLHTFESRGCLRRGNNENVDLQFQDVYLLSTLNDIQLQYPYWANFKWHLDGTPKCDMLEMLSIPPPKWLKQWSVRFWSNNCSKKNKLKNTRTDELMLPRNGFPVYRYSYG